jgi:hypothetical protein
MNKLQLILTLLVLSFSGSMARGESTEESTVVGDTLVEVVEDSIRYVVSVQRVTVADMRIDDTLMISLNSFGNPLAGFELKFAVESPFIYIDTVLPGEVYDSCNWEFFSSRQIDTHNKENYPPVVWQAVALADMMPGADRPVCFGFEREASLIKLVVSNEHIARVPDTVAPIFFFWEDCSDNTIAGISGDTLAISAKVFNYYNVECTEDRELFPTRTGAPKQCIDPAARNKPHREIEFHNGGVEFKLDLGKDTADSTETSTGQ